MSSHVDEDAFLSYQTTASIWVTSTWALRSHPASILVDRNGRTCTLAISQSERDAR